MASSSGNNGRVMRPRHMSLGVLLLANGNHIAGWRAPDSRPDSVHDIRYYQHLARVAEQACFDLIFLADSVGIRERGGRASLGRSHQLANLEPLTLLSALSVTTRHIGLVATASTTYNEPYHVARKFASLDHISGGRAGWNAVTSFTDTEAYNFGRDKHLAHALRYQRAREFVEVVRGLWDTWEDDAFVYQKEDGIFADMHKMHLLAHQGPHFSVRGPLNIARAPQGHPVIFQAGASADGQSLAALAAEVVFTAATTLESARAFNASLRASVAAAGRDPASLKIMPGIFVVVAETLAEAQEKHQALQELVHPTLAIAVLSSMLGFDLSAFRAAGPLPPMPKTEGHQSRQTLLVEQARQEQLSIEQLAQRVANAVGHKVLVGSGAQVADELTEWFEQGAADGFNLLPPTLPGGLEDFTGMWYRVCSSVACFAGRTRGSRCAIIWACRVPQTATPRPMPPTPPAGRR